MQPIKIGILGLGTVGSGVAAILKQANPQLSSYHLQLKKAAVRHITKQRLADYPDLEFTTDPFSVVSDPDLDVIIEVMGGIDEPLALLKTALSCGKHVITANKDLIATHGITLANLAVQHHVGLYYEAAVMGGIPILRTLATNFAGDHIYRLVGIANGTSNYILTQMAAGKSYQDALSAAQTLGFAESDPTNDVAGVDAAYKLTILCRLAFGLAPKLSAIRRQGITELTPGDFEAACFFGMTIKPLVVAERLDNQLSLHVSPYLVPGSYPLSSVTAENNAVVISSKNTRQLTLSGPGAGSLPTANAVVSDLTQVASTIVRKVTPQPAFGALSACGTAESKNRRLLSLTTDGLLNGMDVAVQLGLHGEIYQKGNQLQLLTQAVTDEKAEQWRLRLTHFERVLVVHALPLLGEKACFATAKKLKSTEKSAEVIA